MSKRQRLADNLKSKGQEGTLRMRNISLGGSGGGKAPCHLAGTAYESYQDIWQHKATDSQAIPSGVGCVITDLAVLVEYRCDKRTDRRTNGAVAYRTQRRAVKNSMM